MASHWTATSSRWGVQGPVWWQDVVHSWGKPRGLEAWLKRSLSLPPRLQFWVHAAPLADGPAEFVFEAVNGKKVKGRCDNPHKEQSLPNFD